MTLSVEQMIGDVVGVIEAISIPVEWLAQI
jgi:hypothetical protein